MKRYCVAIVILISFCMAEADVSKLASPEDGSSTKLIQRVPEYFPGRVVIAEVGDSRSVLGPQGKNICVSSDGNTIAVIYGPPSDPYDTSHPFNGVWIAYSTDRGETWNLYGPHNTVSPLRRIYPCVDGGEDFHQDAGNTFFSWQEGQVGYDPTNNFTMIDENFPSSPSFSYPVMLSGDIDGWWPCIGVAPDDMSNVMVTSYAYHAGDSYVIYAYVSDDGGYAWSDSIRMTPPTPPYNPGSGSGGHFRWGTGGYAYYAYHAEHNSAEWPHFVETTDGGYTWSSPEALPAISSIHFWWHERECEVINDLPFAAHNDMDAIFQLFHPDPNDPGSPGSWNWIAVNVNALFDGAHTYQGTTWTCTHIQYPSISYEPNLDVIVVSFKANYEIAPPPDGWTDGNYQGGILSTDGGRNWYPTRPLSGPLLQAGGGPSEAAHRLVTMPAIPGTTYIYTTWTDADDAVIGNQYFELGIVWAIEDTIFGPGYDPGVVEYDGNVLAGAGLLIFPTVADEQCHIVFNILQPGDVYLKIYDAVGRMVKTISRKQCGRGENIIDLDTSELVNGVYIISLEYPSGRDVGKFIINR